MSYFPYAFRKVLVGTGAIRTSGSSADLKPGEIALVDAKSYAALPVGSTYSTNRKVLLAQGSFHTIESLALGHGGLKDSIKTRDIQGHFITDFRLANPKRAQNHIVTIGWDGASATKTLSAECDKDYYIRLDVKGEPVLKFVNHNLYHTFHVKTPCCDPCVDDCPPTSVDPQWVADEFVKQINDHQYISKFIKAEKIVECTPPPGADPNDVAYNFYCLSVCDTGDQAALAAVQSAYPTFSVTRKSREASISTYQLFKTGAAPSAFSTGVFRVIPNCTTCPSGYTLVPKLYKVQIKREDAGDAGALTQINTDYTGETGSLTTRVSYELGTSTYIVYFAALADANTAVSTPVGNDDNLLAGSIESVCTLDTPTNVSWVACGTGYKTTRLLKITINKTCGGSSRLSEVAAFLASDSSYVAASATQLEDGNCTETIQVRQLNNAVLQDGCDSKASAVFDSLNSFEGRTWEVVAPAVTAASCLVGIKLTGAYVETKFGDCSFDPSDAYELDVVRIEVAQLTSFFEEYANRCESGWPVTEIQTVQYSSGVGESVRRELITFLGYRKEDYFCDPRKRETQDIDPVVNFIDRNKFYKIYYITYNVPYTNNSTNLYNDEQYEVMVVFPEEANTKTFEDLINGYITSLGVQLRAI